MTDEQIRAAWGQAKPALYDDCDIIPSAMEVYSRGYQDGYSEAMREIRELMDCAVGRIYQPIDDGSKAVPPGDE